MPDIKVKVSLGGKQVDGIEKRFSTVKEDWNEYEVEDGTIFRMKNVLSRIIRTEEYDANGDPVYSFNTTVVTSVTIPDELRKK